MLKGLGIILALAFCVLPMQAYAQPDKTQQTYAGNKPSSPVAPVRPKEATSPKLQTEERQHVDADVRVISTPEKDGWDKSTVWVNLALAVIGVCGIGAAFITLRKLERQTIATERAANSALQQIHMLKSKERACLSISPLPLTAFRKDEPQEIGFSVTNLGSTRAVEVRIISICKVDGFGGVPLDPQAVPRDGCILADHLDGGKEDVSRIKVVRPDSSANFAVPLFWFPSIENVNKIRNVNIDVSGRVDYDDIFGAHYHFRFRYWFHLLEFDLTEILSGSHDFPIVSVAKWNGYEDDEEREPNEGSG